MFFACFLRQKKNPAANAKSATIAIPIPIPALAPPERPVAGVLSVEIPVWVGDEEADAADAELLVEEVVGFGVAVVVASLLSEVVVDIDVDVDVVEVDESVGNGNPNVVGDARWFWLTMKCSLLAPYPFDAFGFKSNQQGEPPNHLQLIGAEPLNAVTVV